MSFGIHILDKYELTEVEDEKELSGKIEIGDFKENLTIPISFWSISKYISQWKQAVSFILESSAENKSALITQVYNPEHSEYINCWPMYREGETVFVQNRLLLKEDLGSDLNPEKIEQYIDKREIVDEDGNKISEWKTTISELRLWQNKL